MARTIVNSGDGTDQTGPVLDDVDDDEEDYSFSLYKPLFAVTYTNDKRTFHVRNSAVHLWTF